MSENYTCDACGALIEDGYTVRWRQDLPDRHHSRLTTAGWDERHLCANCWPETNDLRRRIRSFLGRIGIPVRGGSS